MEPKPITTGVLYCKLQTRDPQYINDLQASWPYPQLDTLHHAGNEMDPFEIHHQQPIFRNLAWFIIVRIIYNLTGNWMSFIMLLNCHIANIWHNSDMESYIQQEQAYSHLFVCSAFERLSTRLLTHNTH